MPATTLTTPSTIEAAESVPTSVLTAAKAPKGRFLTATATYASNSFWLVPTSHDGWRELAAKNELAAPGHWAVERSRITPGSNPGESLVQIDPLWERVLAACTVPLRPYRIGKQAAFVEHRPKDLPAGMAQVFSADEFITAVFAPDLDFIGRGRPIRLLASDADKAVAVYAESSRATFADPAMQAAHNEQCRWAPIGVVMPVRLPRD